MIWCVIITAYPAENDEDNNIESEYFQGNGSKSSQRSKFVSIIVQTKYSLDLLSAKSFRFLEF